MKELTVFADMEHFDEAMAFVESAFEEIECPMKTAMQFGLAADELFSNIAFYGYKDMEPTDDPLFGKAIIRVEAEETEDGKTGKLILEDAARQYNPLAKADPDVTLSAEERQIGGLGIYMVKKTMDDMTYEYINGRNVLTMIKKF